MQPIEQVLSASMNFKLGGGASSSNSIINATTTASFLLAVGSISFQFWQSSCHKLGSYNKSQFDRSSSICRSSTAFSLLKQNVCKIISQLLFRYDDDDNDDDRSEEIQKMKKYSEGYEGLIGNTPLVRLPYLSNLIGRNVYVKMESLNPSGSGKDRAALAMIQDAENRINKENDKNNKTKITSGASETNNQQDDNNKDENHYYQNKFPLRIEHIVEGTSGSTGIALAALCASRKYHLTVVMPDDQAKEKQTLLQNFAADVKIVPNCAISNPHHYVNTARRIALEENKEREIKDQIIINQEETNKFNIDNSSEQTPSFTFQCHKEERCNKKRGVTIFMNQFENEANWKAHYTTTGPEIYKQTNGLLNAFVMSAGTGGTIAGVAKFLKEKCQQKHKQKQRSWRSFFHSFLFSPFVNEKRKDNNIKVVLVDPPGSSLHSKVTYGVAFTSQQSECKLKRHRYDTIAEGIGLDRVTANFSIAVDNKKLIDESIQISDQEAIDMAHWLLKKEGMFVGSSSAMNIAGAIHVAKRLPPNSIIVTIICDSGQRHLSRFWNQSFIEQMGLIWPSSASSHTTSLDGQDMEQHCSKTTSHKERIPKCLQDIPE